MTKASAIGLCNGRERCAGARAGVMGVHHAAGEISAPSHRDCPSQESAPPQGDGTAKSHLLQYVNKPVVKREENPRRWRTRTKTEGGRTERHRTCRRAHFWRQIRITIKIRNYGNLLFVSTQAFLLQYLCAHINTYRNLAFPKPHRTTRV